VLLVAAAAGGLTLAGNASTMSSMLRLQTSDVQRTSSLTASSASAAEFHQQYVSRKQRRNRTTFTVTQVSRYYISREA